MTDTGEKEPAVLGKLVSTLGQTSRGRAGKQSADTETCRPGFGCICTSRYCDRADHVCGLVLSCPAS
jgi:hypothetical protein